MNECGGRKAAGKGGGEDGMRGNQRMDVDVEKSPETSSIVSLTRASQIKLKINK